MHSNETLREIHKETLHFFDNIFTSQKLLTEYDILNYENRDFVLNTISKFKTDPNAFIVKPFYELDYKPNSVTRSILIQRDNNGFIISRLSNDQNDFSIIEPFRFVSIIKELVEDENIKHEMYKENIKENTYIISK